MKSWEVPVSFFAGVVLTPAVIASTNKHTFKEDQVIEHEKEIAKLEQGRITAAV